MSTYEEISENLTAQVYELEALQSVYPKELVIGDHGVLAHINEFIKNPMNEVPQKLEYSIEISLNDVRLKKYCNHYNISISILETKNLLIHRDQ